MRAQIESLKPSQSLMLDVIRVGAAAIVAAGHISQHYFSQNWPDVTYLATAAVAVFFILSGFVIRYVTCRRPGSFDNYLKDRATRLYSVVIPALLFTVIADLIARHVNPSFYSYWMPQFVHPMWRILLNLFFAAELWKLDVSPLSNSPFWSLNFEVIYYILYGCAFYLAGARRLIWLAITALIAGPNILILFPAWLLGAATHDLYQRWSASGKKVHEVVWASAGAAALLIAVYTWNHAHRGFMYKLSFYAYGLFGCIVILRLLFLLRKVQVDPKSRGARATRFIAEGTFPIYLFHFPVYVIIAACIPYDHGSAWQKALIFTATIIAGILIGHPCNLLKKKMRDLIERRPQKQAESYELATRQRSVS